MIIKKCEKESFSVIGKQGSTLDGQGFIQKLWKDANDDFEKIAHLVKKDQQGNLIGMWGAMSDFSLSFKPWEDNFSQGLYLAGAECIQDAEVPVGWTKWIIPGYEYLYTECTGMDTFPEMIAFLQENKLELAGAVHDFTNSVTQKNYMYFPIRKL